MSKARRSRLVVRHGPLKDNPVPVCQADRCLCARHQRLLSGLASFGHWATVGVERTNDYVDELAGHLAGESLAVVQCRPAPEAPFCSSVAGWAAAISNG